MKIALYESLSMHYIMVAEIDGWTSKDSGYARVSEIVDVDFPTRPQTEVVLDQLASLDTLEKNVEADYANKKAAIIEKRASLAALTYRPTEHIFSGNIVEH